jgi:hypothetical protein
MRLVIGGKPHGAGVNQLLLRDAAKYYTNILMKHDPGRLSTITVELNLVPNLASDLHNDALCGWLDDRFRPNQFFIDMDADLSYKGSLIGLAHELTHVKQMALGERQESWDGLSMRWFGQPINLADMHYYDLPWEIEAHGREYGLYDRFVESLRGIESDTPAITIDPVRKLRAVG